MLTNPSLILGLLAGISSLISVILGYRRSVKNDTAAAQSNIVASQHGVAELAIEGLKTLVASLQVDYARVQSENISLRIENAGLRQRAVTNGG